MQKREKNGTSYDRKRDFYEKYWLERMKTESCSHISRKKKILELGETKPSGNLLDVGCGDGSFTLILGEKTKNNLYGVDLSSNAVRLACEKGINAKVCDIEQGIPFENSFFDCVFCLDVIEHLLDPDRLLDEIHRLLKPDGYCVLSTPNLAAWYERITLLLGYQPSFAEVSLKYIPGTFIYKIEDKPAGHIRAFTWRALRELIALHNFRLQTVTSAADPLTIEVPLKSLIHILNSLFSKIPSLSGFLIVKFCPA